MLGHHHVVPKGSKRDLCSVQIHPRALKSNLRQQHNVVQGLISSKAFAGGCNGEFPESKLSIYGTRHQNWSELNTTKGKAKPGVGNIHLARCWLLVAWEERCVLIPKGIYYLLEGISLNAEHPLAHSPLPEPGVGALMKKLNNT